MHRLNSPEERQHRSDRGKLRTALIGGLAALAGIIHIVATTGRTAPAQMIWPLLAGVVVVWLAAREASVSPRSAAGIGIRGGVAGVGVILLMGSPIMLQTVSPPSGTSGAGVVGAIVVGILSAAVAFFILIVLAAVATGAVVGSRSGGSRVDRAE